MISRHYEKFMLVGILLMIAVFADQAYGPVSSSPAVTSPENASLLASASETLSVPEKPAVPENGAVASRASQPLAFKKVSDEEPPVINTEVALIADLKTGEEYFIQNAGARWPIASITKLMTAVQAGKTLNPKTTVVLRAEDFSALGGDLAKNLKSGDTYSVRDLMRAMLLFSSNESAEALANSYGRSSFLDEMNSIAEEWGLANTHFADPTGLSSLNQSTGRDLVRMARNILESHPGVFAVTRLPSADITDLATGKILRIYSNNEFVGTRGFVGGKTGYTDEAKENLLSVFSYQERPIIVIVMGSSGNRFDETQKLMDWFMRTHKRNI